MGGRSGLEIKCGRVVCMELKEEVVVVVDGCCWWSSS